MMADANNPLKFTIQFCHLYYTNKVFTDLVVQPTALTRQYSRRNNFLFKAQKSNNNNQLIVFNENGLPGNADAPLWLTFTFNATHPSFIQVTDVPFELEKGKVFHFYGDLSSARAELSANGTQVTAQDMTFIKPKCFSYPLSGGDIIAPGADVSIADHLTGKLIKVIQILAPGNVITVDLSDFPSGRYILQVKGNAVLDFYSDDHLYFNKPTGIISFNCQPVPADTPVNPIYKITFPARKILWQYLVVNKNKTYLLKNINIQSCTGSMYIIPFNETRQLSNGDVAGLFQTNEIDCAERTDQRFMLNINKDGNNSPPASITNLPGAEMGAIMSNGTIYFSEIYIYI